MEDIAAIENATTEVELFGTQLNSTPLRRSTRRRGAGTTAIQGTQDTQTPMPLNEVPNGIGPPPPDSLTATRGMSHRHFLQILFFAPPTQKPSSSSYGLACCKFNTVPVSGMNCGPQPSLPQAPSLKAPESCSTELDSLLLKALTYLGLCPASNGPMFFVNWLYFQVFVKFRFLGRGQNRDCSLCHRSLVFPAIRLCCSTPWLFERESRLASLEMALERTMKVVLMSEGSSFRVVW